MTRRVLTEQQRVAIVYVGESQRLVEAHNGRRVRLLLRVQSVDPVLLGFGQAPTEESGMELRREDGPLIWEVNPPQCSIYATMPTGVTDVGRLCVLEAVDEG
jgi:hypothetical protein